MSRYALIDGGTVVNVIAWDGVEYNPETGEGWSPPDGVSAVRVEDGDVPNIGLRYSDGVFEQSSAGELVIAPPTAEEIQAANAAAKNTLLVNAATQIAPLQDAVDLDEATADEVALLKAWKQYRVAVNRVDLAKESPAWPTRPE
ncbi:tail fiber assembly protein [Pseudomonas sp. HS6-2]|uniref:tail fiber assembly protein n=1 Tax=Pseudomonas sp. HS6-2 TaxID=3410986 RepID=UPI003BD4C2CD